MTVFTLQAPMPETLLSDGAQVIFEAISPTTGAAVAGVTVTTFAIYGEDAQAEPLEEVVPLYTPADLGEA